MFKAGNVYVLTCSFAIAGGYETILINSFSVEADLADECLMFLWFDSANVAILVLVYTKNILFFDFHIDVFVNDFHFCFSHFDDLSNFDWNSIFKCSSD